VPFVENVVAIYKSLEATFCPSLFHKHSSGEFILLLESFSNWLRKEIMPCLMLNLYIFKIVDVGDERVLEPCQAVLNSTSSSIQARKLPMNLPNLNKVGVVKNHKSKIAGHDKAEELEFSHGRGKPNVMQSSHVEMDVNQVTQSAPDSPLFCDTKGSDNDCSDQDSEHVRKTHSCLWLPVNTQLNLLDVQSFINLVSHFQTLNFSNYLLIDWETRP